MTAFPCRQNYSRFRAKAHVRGDMVKELVSESAANSLQLAIAIRLGNIAQALEFVEC